MATSSDGHDIHRHNADLALNRLRSRLRGSAFGRADEGYEECCGAWNLNSHHQPELVVMAEDSEDVQHAVRYAASRGLGVGVMATGHGTGTPCIGGVLVNTSRMRGVRVDPDTGHARVAAGTRWSEVIEAAAPHGLAGLAGSSPGTGVVGYTLGGGFGWLGRRFGLAAHSAVRAELITANGDLVTASAGENSELWWGLRGGTGNFGIVTALEFRLHPVRQVYAGNLYYPLERAAELLEFFADWTRAAPDELTAAATFRRFPHVPAVPDPVRGRSLIALRGCFCGDPAAGKALVDRARAALGPAVLDSFSAIPPSALASLSMDPIDPVPAMNHTELLADLTADTIAALVDLGGPEARSPLVMLEIRQLGGALNGDPDMLSPMAHTAARYSVNAIGITPDAPARNAVRAHLDAVAHRLAPFATGDTYLNWLDLDAADPDRIAAAYSAADRERLTRLKRRIDPRNTFRFNRNLPDAAPAVSTPSTTHTEGENLR